MELKDLNGLGPTSEKQLKEVGIQTIEDLKALGATRAYFKLKQQNPRVSLNFLYALVGALENRHWQDVARHDKERLVMEIEGLEALDKITQPPPKPQS